MPDTEPRSAQLSPGCAYRRPLVARRRLVSHSSAKQAQVQFPHYAAETGSSISSVCAVVLPLALVSLARPAWAALALSFRRPSFASWKITENHGFSKYNARALPIAGCRDSLVYRIIADGCPVNTRSSKRPKAYSPIAKSGSSNCMECEHTTAYFYKKINPFRVFASRPFSSTVRLWRSRLSGNNSNGQSLGAEPSG